MESACELVDSVIVGGLEDYSHRSKGLEDEGRHADLMGTIVAFFAVDSVVVVVVIVVAVTTPVVVAAAIKVVEVVARAIVTGESSFAEVG